MSGARLALLLRGAVVAAVSGLLAGCGNSGAPAGADAGGLAAGGEALAAEAAKGGARCGGTPLEIARRDLKQQVNPTATAEEIAATIQFMEPQAPLYPCAEQLFAISPPDGSGSAQLNFQSRDKQAAVVAFYRQAMAGKGKVELDTSGPVQSVILTSGDLFVAAHVHPPDEDGLVAVFIEKEGAGGAGEAARRGAGDPADAEKPAGDLASTLRLDRAAVPAGVRELGPNPQAARDCGMALIEVADVAPDILLSGVFSRVCRVETRRPGTVGLYIQAENRDKAKPFPKPIAVNLACELPREFEACWKAREPWSRLDPPRNCLSYEHETSRRAGLKAIGQCLVAKAGPPADPAFAKLRDAEAGEARQR